MDEVWGPYIVLLWALCLQAAIGAHCLRACCAAHQEPSAPEPPLGAWADTFRGGAPAEWPRVPAYLAYLRALGGALCA